VQHASFLKCFIVEFKYVTQSKYINKTKTSIETNDVRNGSSLSYFPTKNEVLCVHRSSVVDLLAVDERLIYLPWMCDHS